MDSERVIDALRRLEQVNPNLSGYTAKEVLFAMGEKINRATEKAVRTLLRSLISKKLYPVFASAGDDDIVYCPDGKQSGLYRLSIYRAK